MADLEKEVARLVRREMYSILAGLQETTESLRDEKTERIRNYFEFHGVEEARATPSFQELSNAVGGGEKPEQIHEVKAEELLGMIAEEMVRVQKQ
jgi:hypothetical protein